LKLRYAIENRRGGALLSGASGSGKTLVVGILKEILGEKYLPLVHVVFPQMTTAELMAYLADELAGETGPSDARGVDQSIRRIQRFLQENTSEERHAVLVVDEAHLIDDTRTFEALRLLMNFEFEGQPAMTLLLVGQPGLLPKLGRMPQLEERMAVKCFVRTLKPNETGEYVSHRLKAAGADRALLEDKALETLHQLAHGIPRRINRLCDLALLIGFAEEHEALGPAQIEAVHEELAVVLPE
jgi:general secretion pathway protein A